jgi:large subunit ribosomal protein L6
MSRIGKKPVQIPDNAKVAYNNRVISVQGENGKLEREIHPLIDLEIVDGVLNVIPANNDRKTIALQGLTRALIANMVTGVTKGFERGLEINGIGYRAELKGKVITFNLGYSHPIEYELPEGITAKVDKTNIKLFGADKELLGHTAANIRMLRPPEPYKGKGIKYADEYIQKKAGKTGK